MILLNTSRWRLALFVEPKMWRFDFLRLNGMMQWTVTDIGPLCVIYKRARSFPTDRPVE